jgi:hypothetical protein
MFASRVDIRECRKFENGNRVFVQTFARELGMV